jgi:hypothetical protein
MELRPLTLGLLEGRIDEGSSSEFKVELSQHELTTSQGTNTIAVCTMAQKQSL